MLRFNFNLKLSKFNYDTSNIVKCLCEKIGFSLYIRVRMKSLKTHFWNTNSKTQAEFLLILNQVYLTVVRAVLVHSSPLESQSCKMQL